MRNLLICIALIAPAPAAAQLAVVPAPLDFSGLATRQEVQAAQSTADAANAAIPAECATVPATDSASGSIGTGSTCLRRADASAKTNVMPAQATTAADGTFSGSWPGTFATTPTTAFGSIKSAADPYICQVSTFTTTTFSGKCWRIIAMTLPGVATSLLNLVLTPYGAPPTGSTVMVVGRQ